MPTPAHIEVPGSPQVGCGLRNPRQQPSGFCPGNRDPGDGEAAQSGRVLRMAADIFGALPSASARGRWRCAATTTRRMAKGDRRERGECSRLVRSSSCVHSRNRDSRRGSSKSAGGLAGRHLRGRARRLLLEARTSRRSPGTARSMTPAPLRNPARHEPGGRHELELSGAKARDSRP